MSKIINYATRADLLAERALRKQSSAQLKELQEALAARSGIAPPPQKMVPLDALHAEKELRRKCKARIKELETEVAELRSQLAVAAR